MIYTPKYVFNGKQIRDNYNEMKSNLYECEIYYALKANSYTEVLRVLVEANANFEVASIGEFVKLVSLGVAPNRVICSLPVKSTEMINTLYSYGCTYFVFDHIDEYIKLKEYAPNALKILRVYITDIYEKYIPYGMSICELKKYIETNEVDLDNIDGVTFYANENYDINKILMILQRCDMVLEMLPKQNKILNIGGNYRLYEEINNKFYIVLNTKLNELKLKYNNLKVLAEPGRSIIKSAGNLYVAVQMIKDRDLFYEIFLDGGIPSGILYPPKDISVVNRKYTQSSERHLYKFYGNTCSHNLLFEKELDFEIKRGDIIVLSNYGSYSLCKSSNFHGWSTPAVEIIT